MGSGDGGEIGFCDRYQGNSNLMHDVFLDHRKKYSFIILSIISFIVAFNAKCNNALCCKLTFS